MSNSFANNRNICESTGSEAYSNPKYGHVMLEALNKQRLDKKHCDFTLEVKNEFIYAHKALLAAASPYFEAMFKHNVKENTEGKVKFTDVEVKPLKLIIDYIYSGEIKISEDIVQSLLFITDLFQIDWIKEQCEQFLKLRVDLTNCFSIWKIAGVHSCKELFVYCNRYILRHFPQLIDSEEFLRLSFEELKAVLTDDGLYVQCEKNAYLSVLNWIKYDIEARKTHLQTLLSHVHLPLLNGEFLRYHTIAEPLLNKELLRLLPNNKRKSSFVPSTSEKRKYHNRYGLPRVLFTGGRVESQPLDACKIYHLSNSKVFTVSSLKEPRRCISTVSLNGLMYTVGGIGGNSNLDLVTAECYDPFINEWTQIASMQTARSSYGACVYNDCIYVVGGNKNTTVENYNPIRNKWYQCPNLSVKNVNDIRAAIIENSIYALGSKQTFRFDSREGQWYNLDNSIIVGVSFEVVSYGHSLYCIGGCSRKSNCRRFDVRSNSWETLSPMNVGRHGHSVLIIEGGIYAFGGWYRKALSTVERYDFQKDKWTIDDSVKIAHSYGGAALIHYPTK
uniref:Kelch-like protein diablo n=1 Tax=Glossina brevipalpis TaxID=37001 RepID=A0A1A9WMS8_9MUSC